MQLTWHIQGSDERTRCSRCNRMINPFRYYYRAAFDLDRDQFGYDVCAPCRKQLPAEPPTELIPKPQ